MRTSELTGAALDWAVAKCEGMADDMLNDFDEYGWAYSDSRRYSTDWTQGGPIIEREGINLFQRKGIAAKEGRPWLAYNEAQLEQHGPTPLIAAMRRYVASKLGETIDIPEGLR
jgi:hypothetical protein